MSSRTKSRRSSTSRSKVATRALPRVLSVAEVALFVGVDRKVLYRALANGRLPGARLGRRYVIYRDALIAWLSGQVRVASSR